VRARRTNGGICRWVPRRSMVVTGILAWTVASGCATEPRKSDERPVAIERVPYQTFEGTTDMRPAFAHIEVRLAQAPEVAHVWPNSFFEGLRGAALPAALGLTVGLLAPPIGAHILFGAILMPFVGAENANTERAIARALQEVDLPKRLQDALQSRLAGGSAGRPDDTMKLAILVLGYGFFNPGGLEGSLICFSFDGDVQVTAADQVIYQERVYMEPYRRSLDVPPPRCATLDAFGKDDGKLTRETLEDASDVMAAVIAGRLRANR